MKLSDRRLIIVIVVKFEKSNFIKKSIFAWIFQSKSTLELLGYYLTDSTRLVYSAYFYSLLTGIWNTKCDSRIATEFFYSVLSLYWNKIMCRSFAVLPRTIKPSSSVLYNNMSTSYL
jgi:hypothetical protein